MFIQAELFKVRLRKPRVSARFEFRFENLKSISVLIFFIYKLMIGSPKNIRKKIIPENAFEYKKNKPGLSAKGTFIIYLEGGL